MSRRSSVIREAVSEIVPAGIEILARLICRTVLLLVSAGADALLDVVPFRILISG